MSDSSSSNSEGNRTRLIKVLKSNIVDLKSHISDLQQTIKLLTEKQQR